MKQQLESLVSEMVDKGIRFSEARREFEKRFIANVLQRHKGNLSRAAKDLRIHRNTLGQEDLRVQPLAPPGRRPWSRRSCLTRPRETSYIGSRARRVLTLVQSASGGGPSPGP